MEADEAPAPRVEKKAGAAGKGRASETPVQRADRMFAEGRWIEAAAAYRTLLRDDPKSGDADRWRKRLALAEGEIETAQRTAAKAAKASKAPSKATSKASDAASQ